MSVATWIERESPGVHSKNVSHDSHTMRPYLWFFAPFVPPDSNIALGVIRLATSGPPRCVASRLLSVIKACSTIPHYEAICHARCAHYVAPNFSGLRAKVEKPNERTRKETPDSFYFEPLHERPKANNVSRRRLDRQPHYALLWISFDSLLVGTFTFWVSFTIPTGRHR